MSQLGLMEEQGTHVLFSMYDVLLQVTLGGTEQLFPVKFPKQV